MALRTVGREPAFPSELIADWYGASVAWSRHVDWPATWGHVRDVLDARCPVIVVADSFHLPYCWQYRKEHSPHRIVLTGYTDAGVEVSDGYRGSMHRGRSTWTTQSARSRRMD